MGPTGDTVHRIRHDEAALHQAVVEFSDDAKFRLAVESSPNGMVMVDATGTIVLVNAETEKLFGYDRRELIGMPVDALVPQRLRGGHAASRGGFLAHPTARPMSAGRELFGLRKDGSEFPVEIGLNPIHTEDGVFVLSAIVDITERKRAEVAIRAAQAKYRMLVEQLPLVSYIASLGEEPATLYVSPQIETKLGFSQAEWTVDPQLWSQRLHPEDRERVLSELKRWRESGSGPLRLEYRMIARDGTVRWFRDEAAVVRDAGGAPGLVYGVQLDVTEREEERAGRERMQALSRRLVEVQETERRRIARELHDEVGQSLTALKLILESATRGTEGAPRLAEARAIVHDLVSRVHDLALDLRPAMLDDLGLLPALLWLFERYTKQTNIAVQFDHAGLDGDLEPEVQTTAYRIVQEALTNVARHAGVAAVRVRAWSDASTLSVQVEDAGRGFDLETELLKEMKCGLVGMRERVRLLGGELDIDAASGAGCCLAAHLPRGFAREGP